MIPDGSPSASASVTIQTLNGGDWTGQRSLFLSVRPDPSDRYYAWTAPGMTPGVYYTIEEDDPRVEIVGDPNDDHAITAADPTVAYLKIGQWGADHKFPKKSGAAPNGGWGLNGYNEADGSIFAGLGTPANAWANFIDRDPNRFHVRIRDAKSNTDPNTVQTIKARIGTLKSPNVPDDDMTEITLEESGANSGVFISKSQLLVEADMPPDPSYPPDDPAHYADDDVEVHDGFAQGGMVKDDQPGDRTHRVTVDGRVRVEYGQQSQEVRLFRTADGKVNKQKLLEVRVVVFNEWVDTNNNSVFDQGEPYFEVSGDNIPNTVLGTPQQAVARVEAQIERANILWSVAGIEVRRVGVIAFDSPPNNGQGVNALADGVIQAGKGPLLIRAVFI